MATESREYPKRIWAGHLGGGRRIWKPELMHADEAAFACSYVRADIANQTFDALRTAEAFMAGFEGDDLQEGVADKLSDIRAALALASGDQS